MAERDDSAGIEVWRDVPSQPELQASNWGRIRRKEFFGTMPRGGRRSYRGNPTYGVPRRAKKTASHEYMGYGYKTLGNVKVHRIVCEAFHGPCPDGMVCIHLDEDAKNNRPENLKWGTQKENLNMPKYRAWKASFCNSKAEARHDKAQA